jgi:hypothetical protein
MVNITLNLSLRPHYQQALNNCHTNTWFPQSTYINKKSTTVYVPSTELGFPHPLTRKRVCPPPLPRNQRGEVTLALLVRGWGSPNSDKKRLSSMPTLWWYRTLLEGPSTVFWVAVAACTVVIRPSRIPKLSLMTYQQDENHMPSRFIDVFQGVFSSVIHGSLDP